MLSYFLFFVLFTALCFLFLFGFMVVRQFAIGMPLSEVKHSALPVLCISAGISITLVIVLVTGLLTAPAV